MSTSKQPENLPGGVWMDPLKQAFTLAEIANHGISNPFWTFGGGTVLMLRHRMSKDIDIDIDIFVPDPQFTIYGLHINS